MNTPNATDPQIPPVPPATPETGNTPESADLNNLLPATLTPPKGFPEEALREAEANANAIAEKVLTDPEDRSSVRDATRVGDTIQQNANQEFALLRTSLGQVMDRMQSGEKGIPEDLSQLRRIMDEINPYPAIDQIKKAQTAGFISRMFRKVPGIGKVLADIARRYETVQTQIDAITQSLNAGSDRLLANSLEIEERYKQLKIMQKQLRLRGYQLQVLLKNLDAAKAGLPADEQQALRKAVVRIMRRLQNIKVTENAFAQFFITMNVTMDNHDNLRDAIQSMIHLTRPVLENGLALKVAQQDEKRIAEALSASQDYLGNLMVSIAEQSMDSAAQTAKVANEPLVRFQDLVKSYNVLINRMDEASQIETQMVNAARKNMAQLEQMTTDLEKRAEAQESARNTLRKA